MSLKMFFIDIYGLFLFGLVKSIFRLPKSEKYLPQGLPGILKLCEFQYQTMCKSSVELGLVYKTFVNKHTWETPLLPRKNKLHPLFT